RCRHPSDRALAHIARGEDPRNRSLEHERWTFQRPRRGRLSVGYEVRPGEYEPGRIQLHHASHEIAVWYRPYEDEHAGSRMMELLSTRLVVYDHPCQVFFSLGLYHLARGENLDVGGRLDLFHQVSRHLQRQRRGPHNDGHRAGT